MMVDTTIYGYLTDGGAYHPGCTRVRPDGDTDDVTALFYLHDEDPHGLSCDQCGEYIFEPTPPHPFEPYRSRSDFDPGPCGQCGQDREDDLMHPDSLDRSDDHDKPYHLNGSECLEYEGPDAAPQPGSRAYAAQQWREHGVLVEVTEPPEGYVRDQYGSLHEYGWNA